VSALLAEIGGKSDGPALRLRRVRQLAMAERTGFDGIIVVLVFVESDGDYRFVSLSLYLT
jgi:hypothetical protein